VNPLDFTAGILAGVLLALVVLLPARRPGWSRGIATTSSEDVATAFRLARTADVCTKERRR
jgi:hypothetical protein